MTPRDHTDDLIITDTSPLITLALGEHLHALTAPGLRVVIPDAVFTEATRFEGAPGASELIEWVARNDDLVTVRPTETGQDQLQRLRDGRSIRGMGEAAALEVLATTAEYHPSRHLFLIFEDKDLETDGDPSREGLCHSHGGLAPAGRAPGPHPVCGRGARPRRGEGSDGRASTRRGIAAGGPAGRRDESGDGAQRDRWGSVRLTSHRPEDRDDAPPQHPWPKPSRQAAVPFSPQTTV